MSIAIDTDLGSLDTLMVQTTRNQMKVVLCKEGRKGVEDKPKEELDMAQTIHNIGSQVGEAQGRAGGEMEERGLGRQDQDQIICINLRYPNIKSAK